MNDLPYTQLHGGRAHVEEQALVTAFANSTVQQELTGDERFIILTHDDITWTVVNIDLLSTVTAYENGGTTPITRIIYRPLTPAELSVFNKVLDYKRP
ncbi:hypothetical protein ACWDBW_29965 [Streptomyces sp. NPDC001107]